MTNKIFIITCFFIMTGIVVLLVCFNSFAEITPSPVSVTKLTQELKVEEFTGITNGRGFWRIVIEQADTQSVAVYCGDNLFDNYLDVKVIDGVLNLDIKDEFKYEKMASMDVYIKTPGISVISAQKTSVYWLKKIKCNSLHVNTSGASFAILDTCEIANLEIRSRGNTSIKVIEGTVDSVNYDISDNSIVEISKLPEIINGTLIDDAFIKMNNKSILTSAKLKTSQKIELKPFPDLPIVEDIQKLDEHMKEQFDVFAEEKYHYIKHEGDPFLNYFFSHLARATNTNSARIYEGGEFMGQEVYQWTLYFFRGTIGQISIYYPEKTNLPTLLSQLSDIYGFPDKEKSNDRYFEASWNNLFTGIDSSLTIEMKQGVDQSVYLAFELGQAGNGHLALEYEWSYYKYDWIYRSISKSLIEREILGFTNGIAHKQLKSLPFLFY